MTSETIQTAVALGVDIGTSGVRAAAVSEGGAVVGFAATPFSDPGDSRNPKAWWANVERCLAQLASTTSLASIEGVAVDGTSGTVLSVDAAGKPGEVLMYNEPCPDRDIVERISRVAPGNSPAVGSNSGLARAIYLSRPDDSRRVLHQADWILSQLGLETPTSDENNALKSGYDLLHERWPDWIEAAGLDMDRLPDVRRTGTPLAPVGTYLRTLGLPAFSRFHAGTTDGCASFLATGAAAIGDGVTALGSTLVLKLASDRPINAPEFGVYSHRVLGFWLVGGASNSGGAVIRALIGDERLADLTSRLDATHPTGLDYYPLLKPGERFPFNDPTLEPRLTPRPADDAVFFQAVLEGMTEIERSGYSKLRELGAPPLQSVRTVGGGSKNPVWTEMRQRALAVPFAPAWSVEAAVGAASLVLAKRGQGA